MSTQLGRLKRTWFDEWWFWMRTTLLRQWRRLKELGTRPARFTPVLDCAAAAPAMQVLASVRSPLWTSTVATELPLVAGKVENLRRALPAFNGLRLPAGAVLSFWRQLGRPSRWRGFVPGRELREGCVVPSPGGGLCQLSNALYQLAQQAGWQVLERHRHSMLLPGSQASADRDATVYWNHVDLRLRVPMACRLRAGMDAEHLWLRVEAEPSGQGGEAVPPLLDAATGAVANAASCHSCAQVECARQVALPVPPGVPVPPPVMLSVGTPWPEFEQWRDRQSDGRALALLRHEVELGERALGWWARQRGQTRVQRQLDAERRAARRLGRRLQPMQTRVLVPQALLPHMWLDGVLGGRRFEVLLTRPPLAQLHATLDACARAHPRSSTAHEFRAPAALVAAETEALAAAERWLTPYAGLLEGGPDTRPHQLLSWCAPRALPLLRPRRCTPRVLFPLATAARHGAYELREALLGLLSLERPTPEPGPARSGPSGRGLPLQLLVGGSELEGPDFWAPLQARRLQGPHDWRREVDLVVLPAWVSGRPQQLLQARAAGIPVITTAAAGLRACSGVTLVPVGDVAALRTALMEWLERREHLQPTPCRGFAGAG